MRGDRGEDSEQSPEQLANSSVKGQEGWVLSGGGKARDTEGRLLLS